MIIIHCCRIVIWFAMKTSSMNGSYGVILTVALVFFPLIIITFLIIIITNKISSAAITQVLLFTKQEGWAHSLIIIIILVTINIKINIKIIIIVIVIIRCCS